MATALDELVETEKKETTYFAFRVPTDQHRQLRSLLAQRGISGQAFFMHIIDEVLKDATSASHLLLQSK